MHLPATPTALLFAYAFLSNIALAVVPHEPAIIWYGPRLGVWTTTLVGTAGTVLAAVADHRLFAPLIGRLAQRHLESSPLSATRRGGQGVRTWPERLFRRFPVATIALSGLTPLPFFPFKALAFATGCPAGKYTAAVAARCLPRYALLAWLGATLRLLPGPHRGCVLDGGDRRGDRPLALRESRGSAGGRPRLPHPVDQHLPRVPGLRRVPAGVQPDRPDRSSDRPRGRERRAGAERTGRRRRAGRHRRGGRARRRDVRDGGGADRSQPLRPRATRAAPPCRLPPHRVQRDTKRP